MFASMQRALSSSRPSPSERDRALGALKQRYREGRLSTEELEALVERVYRTVRRSEIAAYVWAMPLLTVRWLALRKVRRLQSTVMRFHVATFATINATALGVWALTGEGTFWPAVVLLPTTALLAWHAVLSRRLTRALGRRGW
ncbi:MAG TPA: DUF1707 domain-containing protein [Solirubrobacteraceae bacterium]|nr:DUF1707 domain-containing protein [Solirubrobacteraceae bacterium]